MIADTAIDRDFLQSLRGTEIANLAEEGRAAIFHGEQRRLCTAHLIERRDRLLGERPVGKFEQKVTRHAGLGGDRKSVVSGKCVSVRVDLGGRRNLNKKMKRNHDDKTVRK